MKLIDKDALVAEIERRLHFDNNWIEGDKRRQIHTNGVSSAYYKMIGSKHACENILDFIDSLEVKEAQEEPISKNYIERYKRIAQSEKFKKTYEGMSVGEIMHVEGEEPVSEDFDALDQLLAKYAIDFSYKGKTLKECSDIYKAEIIATANHLEPVSEELEEIAWNHADKKCHLDIAVFTPDEVKKERGKIQFTWQDLYDAVMFGAQSQKAKDQEIIELARDLRYKENLEVKEVDLESLVRQVIDLYLEAGEHYNSVIKEEREENGGSDLVIKLLDGVIDAKELSIQYVLDKLKAQKGEEAMAQFISLRTQGRCGEIMVNVDEISSCHIEGGFSYTDYILILKNGTRYNLNAESYNKVTNLTSE